MHWEYEFAPAAFRELAKLDKQTQRAIIRYLDERLSVCDDPRNFGHALAHELSGYWRWRVANYRIIGEIFESKLLITVIKIGHRSKIYERR
ncbi:MAG: type II toxin-antitoxin system RelE/ParE family toxin [Puniceicoccales bacterium]|jgi:mRNA interferase RelE/StbE|nr:type II toxin-antitoxin system RelE/ParE family toxin [Puniceicoccales bacterium]